jgi:hypothetical protein
MSTQPVPAAPSPKRDKPVNRWHRNAGVAAAGLLVYLLATGIPLQFSSELNLGQRFVGAAWILDWYGLAAPDLVTQSGDVVQVGQWLFLDGRARASMSAVVGAVTVHDFTLVAGRDELLLLHSDPDHLPEKTHIDSAVKRIGRSQTTAYLDTDDGLLSADPLLINWRSATQPTEQIDWAGTTELRGPAAADHKNRFRMRMLTIERWLQDLHSGRFF